MNFDFISDQNFREILVRDYKELKSCLKTGSIKCVLILSGSIIEAVLTEYFLQFPPEESNSNDILKSNLNTLIEYAVQSSIISENEKKLAEVVKDYRNLIHPGREIRKGKKLNLETAEISKRILNIIIESVKSVYLERYCYSADQVFEKLKNDWHSHTVFSQIIEKLNENEKVKLLGYLIDYDKQEKSMWKCFIQEGDINEYPTYNLESVKPLVLELTQHLPKTLIKSYLAKMIEEIETGETVSAYSLFHLFHENLDLLTDAEQESVVIYMLSIYGTVYDENRFVISDKTYSTIGKYIKSDKSMKALKGFLSFCVVHFIPEIIKSEMDLLEQVFNCLPANRSTEAKTYLTDFLSPINNPPSNLDSFFYEALNRNLIIR